MKDMEINNNFSEINDYRRMLQVGRVSLSPSREPTYSPSNKPSPSPTLSSGLSDSTYNNNIRFYADVNGDGKADFCRIIFNPITESLMPSCLIAGNSFFSAVEYSIYDTHQYVNIGLDTNLRFFADVNGDNKDDFCRMFGIRGTSDPLRPSCLLAGDNNFSNKEFTTINPMTYIDPGYQYMIRLAVDVNGDGKADFCRMVGDFEGSAKPVRPRCNLASDDSFSNTFYDLSSINGFDRGFDGKIRFFADVNGDGKADFCRMIGELGSYNNPIKPSCILASSTGFSNTVYTLNIPGFDSGNEEMIRYFADVNGDGKADFCRILGKGTYNDSYRPSCLLAGPLGFTNTEFTISLSNNYIEFGDISKGQSFADVNGDGKADFCRILGKGTYSDNYKPSCLLSDDTMFTNFEYSTYDQTKYVDIGYDYLPNTIHPTTTPIALPSINPSAMPSKSPSLNPTKVPTFFETEDVGNKLYFSDICKKGLLLKLPVNKDTNSDGKEDWICEYANGTIDICYSDGGTDLKCGLLQLADNHMA